ncbi:hypothetical protein ACIQBJ_20385 [Kitasatospora sp. NPDC088391]|uniref:hypothetical protein n=1 Tax=Kitasatospora sp. NPDC088391 TaxID=3364074 RepID=UPI00381A9D79
MPELRFAAGAFDSLTSACPFGTATGFAGCHTGGTGCAGCTAPSSAASLPSTDAVLASGVFGGDHFRDQSGPAAAATETGTSSEATTAPAAATANRVRCFGGD